MSFARTSASRFVRVTALARFEPGASTRQPPPALGDTVRCTFGLAFRRSPCWPWSSSGRSDSETEPGPGRASRARLL